jgi:hypothetical protein
MMERSPSADGRRHVAREESGSRKGPPSPALSRTSSGAVSRQMRHSQHHALHADGSQHILDAAAPSSAVAEVKKRPARKMLQVTRPRSQSSSRRPPPIREEKRFFYYHGAREVSQKLALLASGSAESALERKELLGDHAVESVAPSAEGARVNQDGGYDVSAKKTLLQRRNSIDMRKTLAQLKASLAELGISIDVSRGKDKLGRMQGNKWDDGEIDKWKSTASRMFSTTTSKKTDGVSDDWQMEEMLANEVFKAKDMMNKARFERTRRQKRAEDLEFELAQLLDYRDFMSRSDGEEARVQDLTSTLLEQISEYEVKWEGERAERAAMEEEKENLEAELHDMEAAIASVRDDVERHQHDIEGLTVQLRQGMHAMEVSLGQGKLHSMKKVQKQLKVSYVSELEGKAKVVKSQIDLKGSLMDHEARLEELTQKLKLQFDPELDSPRRNALRSKAREFESAFASLKERFVRPRIYLCRRRRRSGEKEREKDR